MKVSESIIEKGKAGYSGIYLLTSEDQRVLGDIKEAVEVLDRKLFVWSHGKGLIADKQTVRAGQSPSAIADTEIAPGLLEVLDDIQKVPEGSVVVLKLFHHLLDDLLIQTALRSLITEYKSSRRMIIILTPVLKLPPELEKDFALLEVDLPTKAEFRLALEGITKNLPEEKHPSPEKIELLLTAALGLTTTEAENAFSLSLIRPHMQGKELWDPQIVMEEKCASLKKTGILEYIPLSAMGLNVVGGLDNLKEFIGKRKRAFTQEARDFGLPLPKGVLLIGPPGTGKTLGAKAVAGEFGYPLLKLDMGKVYGGIVGSSEANIRTALQTAEALAPCVLWVDEIEKGMAGGSGSLDSGVSQRVQGTILTWMQEKEAAVFVYATCNTPTLPPEMMRKGRFDEMFSVDLPTSTERAEIFKIHLKRRGRLEQVLQENQERDMKNLVDESNGFTGAEIEAAIEDAMFSAFHEGRDALSKTDIIISLSSTQPQSKTMSEHIKAIREWCQARTRPANIGELVDLTTVVGNSRRLDA